jgi:hypothetical protein
MVGPTVIPSVRVDAPVVAPAPHVAPPVIESVVPAVPSLAKDNPVFTGLDELKQEVAKPKRVEIAAGTAVGTGVALTAGTVLLSPRLAYWFLSAFLARRTVWKPFDPLEVVYAWERGEKAGGREPDDDSLEGMVG